MVASLPCHPSPFQKSHRMLQAAFSLCILLFLTLAPPRAAGQAPPSSFTTTLTQSGTTITIDYYYHPIRGPHFEVLVQDSTGAYTPFTSDVSRTYLGYVQGNPGALAIATYLPDGTIWQNVSFEDGVEWNCYTGGGTVDNVRGNPVWTPNWPTTPTAGAGGAGSVAYAGEVGVDCRWTYFNALAQDTQLLVYKVEHSIWRGGYIHLRDNGILHNVGRIIVRGDQTKDPYDGVASGSLLDTLRTEWNTNQTTATRVVAALVSPGFGGGVAYVNTAGGSSAYSVSGTESGDQFGIVWRHEVGHNWGASDNEAGIPEGPTIMAGNSLSRFSGPEERDMVARRGAIVAQLTNLGAYSFALPPHAALDLGTIVNSATSTLDVLSNDHDLNGGTLTISGFDTTSVHGGTIALSVGTGPGGRNQLVYTPPTDPFWDGVDRFTYWIQDPTGRDAMGNVFVRRFLRDDNFYWKLDETTGTVANDASPVSLNGTLINGPTWTTGVLGGAAAFDGVDDKIDVPYSAALNPSQFTVSCWAKVTGGAGTYRSPLTCRKDGPQGGYLFYAGTNNMWQFWTGKGSGWNQLSGGAVALNTWTHLTGTYDGTTMRFYVNGTLASSANVSVTLNDSSPLRIGAGASEGTGSFFFPGSVDDVRVYPRALSATEISGIYQGNAPAANPTPEYGGNVFSTSTTLSWTGPSTATSHNVYLGTSYSAVRDATTASPEFKGNQSTTTYSASSLSLETTYYWRIDEVTPSGTTKGYVWVFNAINAFAFDAFDSTGATIGDDAGDPMDMAWSTIGGGTLSVVDDSGGLGTANALNDDTTSTFHGAKALFTSKSLSAVGSSITLSFDFRYTQNPGNTTGLRFGFFNSGGDGFFVSQGTGGTTGFSLCEDTGGDGGYGSGSTQNTFATISAPSLSGTGIHELSITLTKTATGLSVSASVDGQSLSGSDTTPVITTFDRIAIRNGSITADFRVDNVRVKYHP